MYLLMLLAVPYICGCETFSKTRSIEISGLIFQNNTSSHLYDVRLVVEKIRGVVSCSSIPAGKECSTTFPLRTYQGNPIRVLWQQNGNPFSSEQFLIELPESLVKGEPAMVLVIIGDWGRIVARLVQ